MLMLYEMAYKGALTGLVSLTNFVLNVHLS